MAVRLHAIRDREKLESHLIDDARPRQSFVEFDRELLTTASPSVPPPLEFMSRVGVGRHQEGGEKKEFHLVERGVFASRDTFSRNAYYKKNGLYMYLVLVHLPGTVVV